MPKRPPPVDKGDGKGSSAAPEVLGGLVAQNKNRQNLHHRATMVRECGTKTAINQDAPQRQNLEASVRSTPQKVSALLQAQSRVHHQRASTGCLSQARGEGYLLFSRMHHQRYSTWRLHQARRERPLLFSRVHNQRSSTGCLLQARGERSLLCSRVHHQRKSKRRLHQARGERSLLCSRVHRQRKNERRLL